MAENNEFNHYGEDLERLLHLTNAPIAVKMLKNESEIPAGAIQPTKDRGYHLSQCQAFAMSRRELTAIAMLKEDNWCPGPMVSYGLVPPDSSETSTHNECEHFEYGKYIGILTAPLKSAAFEPDAVLMYADTYQICNLLYAMRPEDRSAIGSHYFAPSCVYSVTTPMITGKYQIVLPDPGEFVRGLTQGNELILTIPGKKLYDLLGDLKRYQAEYPKLLMANMMMRPDFPLPPQYQKAFEGWGLHRGK